MERAESCFDPVAHLVDDLAAICLSCLDVRTLLGVAQHVSHAWKDAVAFRLPALWRDVSLDGLELSDLQLAEVAEKGRDRTRTLRGLNACKVSAQGLDVLRLFSELQVLEIRVIEQHSGPLSALLSSFPLLEDLDVRCDMDPLSGTFPPPIVLPSLQFLRRVRCDGVQWAPMQGLANLPSLTQLKVNDGCVDADAPWPASLRKVTIMGHFSTNPQLLDRLASLQQPTKISTDWMFLPPECFTPPYDQLSFVSTYTNLDTLTVALSGDKMFNVAFFNYVGALKCLRKLVLVNCFSASDEDFKCVSQLPNLQELKINGNRRITSQALRHIAAIPDLHTLHLNLCDEIQDYSPLGVCHKLRRLHISTVGRGCSLSLSDVQAISQLHLTVLHCRIESPPCFMPLCGMRSLRRLAVWSTPEYSGGPSLSFPVATFATPQGYLPDLSCMEDIMFPVASEDTSVLVDCLVQMPKLRRIVLQNKMSEQDEARLRAALPRLEKLEVDANSNSVKRDCRSEWSCY